MNIEKLLKLLKERNMTAYRLAKESGVSRGQLSDLINGKKPNPSINTVIKIAKVLGCKVDDIILK